VTVAMASRFQVKPSTSKLKAVCAGAMLVLRRVGVEGLVVGFQHVSNVKHTLHVCDVPIIPM